MPNPDKDALVMRPDHERIWLEPPCDGSTFSEEGRQWCKDKVWDACPDCGTEPTEYVRADLMQAELSRLSAALEQAEAEGEKLRGELVEARAERDDWANGAYYKDIEEVEGRAEAAEAALAACREALEPFATFAEHNVDDDGWAGTRCEGERIVDWFGPSDFRRARAALSPTSQQEG